MAKKKAPKKKAAKKKAAKQTNIPGTAPRRIDELYDAAEEYKDKRDERMELDIEEAALKKTLTKVMKKYKDKLPKDKKGKPFYRDPDWDQDVYYEVEEEKETVRVRTRKKAKQPKGEAA